MKILALASLAVFLLQLAVNPLQQQKPQGSIEGNVTRTGSAQPVAGAQVRITRRGGPVQAAPTQGQPVPAGRGAPTVQLPPAITDDKGKFVFPGLEDGTYTVQALANGFVPQAYGQRFPAGPPQPITVTAGQAVKDINVSLQAAANISGRIRDVSSQPLVNVPVQLLRYSYDGSGQRTYQSAGTTLTNDLGEYRIYWVTPGRYYLLAGRPSTGSSPFDAIIALDRIGANGNEVRPISSYAFYPGVAEITNARAIDLQPGADLQAVDLTLSPKPRTFSVRGKLIDSRTGQPPRRANVFVATQTPGLSGTGIDPMLGQLGPLSSTQNYDATTGSYTIRGLLPGSYTVIALMQDPTAGGRGAAPQSTGSMPVSISMSDVDGVAISLTPSMSIPGRLRVEGQLPSPMTIDRFRVRLVPVGPVGIPSESAPSVMSLNPDGTFRLNNVIPGEYRIEASVPVAGGAGVPFLKEARFEGVDVLNTPMKLSTASNNGLELTVSTAGGQITGTLSDVRSQPLPGMRVVLVPDRARYRTDLYRTANTDPNGRFTFASVSPGDYKVYSWESIDDYAWFDPDILSRSGDRGRVVHVTETSSESVDVRIIPAEALR